MHACGATVPAAENPGVVLGAILGTAATSRPRQSNDHFFRQALRTSAHGSSSSSPSRPGKIGKGIIPVDRERLAKPENYGNDRVFAYLRLESAPDQENRTADRRRPQRKSRNRPVVQASQFVEPYALGEANFSAGKSPRPWPGRSWASTRSTSRTSKPARLKRANSRANTQNGRQIATLNRPSSKAKGVKLYADPRNTEALKMAESRFAEILKTHLGRAGAGDYFSLCSVTSR